MNNQIKDPKSNKLVEGVSKDGSLEVHVYLNAKGHLPPFAKNISEVYEDRNKLLIVCYIIIALYLISQSPNWQITLFSIFINFFWYDFFSGILHVVLDDPKNLVGWRSVFLYKPCLEF